MKNKKIMLASLLGVSMLAIGISTYAYQWNPGTTNPNCTDTERQAEVTKMFETKNYESFKTLYADKWIARKFTSKDQFLKFVELHQAGLEGNTSKVNELKAELNIGQKRMDGSWQGRMSGARQWGGQGRLNK